jgi:molybdenum cofactor cytidylyltransferase
MGSIWAIILAAGESKRMGFPKMLLSFNGKTMIENVIGNILNSAVDSTMVVLGANGSLLTELINKATVKYCYNDDYREGMLSSVKCGIRNLPPEVEAVMVFQGDQPFITPDVVNSLIEGYRGSGKGIVIPVFESRRGHPLLIDRKYFEEVGMLNSDEGLRSLAYKFSEDVLCVTTDNPGILRDFDTYIDYLEETNKNK